MGLRVEPAMTRKNFDTPSFFSQKVVVVNAWFWCDTSIVNRIWSHGDEVSFIAPSGHYATKLDGTPHDTKGRETQIFERSADGSWRLVHIHYSAAGSQ